MTPAEKKAAYVQRQREAEKARREALGLPQHPHAKPKREAAKPRRRLEDIRDPLDERDNLGESPDW